MCYVIYKGKGLNIEIKKQQHGLILLLYLKTQGMSYGFLDQNIEENALLIGLNE